MPLNSLDDNNLWSELENRHQTKRLPNATGTLVLGILSLVSSLICCTYGIPGLLMGLIGLIISNDANRLMKANPNAYVDSGSLKAGRICCIIGLCVNGIWILFLLFSLAGMFSMQNMTRFPLR